VHNGGGWIGLQNKISWKTQLHGTP